MVPHELAVESSHAIQNRLNSEAGGPCAHLESRNASDRPERVGGRFTYDT
jgi:hypothetical protein